MPERSFLELARATPAELAAKLIVDGLLSNLHGTPCVHPNCGTQLADGLLEHRTLGRLRTTSRAQDASIKENNVFYRCRACQTRVAIIHRGSMVYPSFVERSDVTQRTLAYWNIVHGVSMMMTAKLLHLPLERVSSYYATARAICEHDALCRERNTEFGGTGSLTTDIECGQHTWCEWNVGGRHYQFAWFGLIERRDRSHLLLRLSTMKPVYLEYVFQQ